MSAKCPSVWLRLSLTWDSRYQDSLREMPMTYSWCRLYLRYECSLFVSLIVYSVLCFHGKTKKWVRKIAKKKNCKPGLFINIWIHCKYVSLCVYIHVNEYGVDYFMSSFEITSNKNDAPFPHLFKRKCFWQFIISAFHRQGDHDFYNLFILT